MSQRSIEAKVGVLILIALGLLEDVTREVAGSDAAVATKRLDRDLWAKRRKKILTELDRARIAGSAMAGQQFRPQQDIADVAAVIRQLSRATRPTGIIGAPRSSPRRITRAASSGVI